jgi:hypothetical protein
MLRGLKRRLGSGLLMTLGLWRPQIMHGLMLAGRAQMSNRLSSARDSRVPGAAAAAAAEAEAEAEGRRAVEDAGQSASLRREQKERRPWQKGRLEGREKGK